MTLSPKAVQTARRNLAQRIGRLISTLEKEAREPTPWQAHYSVIALQLLEAERYADGEDVAFKADAEHIYNTPVSPSVLPADAHTATTAELRARLAELYGQG